MGFGQNLTSHLFLQSCKWTEVEYLEAQENVEPSLLLHLSRSCLLGWCMIQLIAGLGGGVIHLIEVVPQHQKQLFQFDHSYLLSQHQNKQTNLSLIVFQTGLKSQIIEKKSELQSVQSECDTLRGKLICRDEELDDIRCQFTAVNNALEVFI